jgi:hypothetical protein
MNSNVEHCLAILKALQISEVTYCLSGGGDSGTAELHGVAYLDGRIGPLPSLTIGITDAGNTIGLDEHLEDIAANFPDGDWCNNEGGYGTVTFRPQESDADLQVECDMTYGEENVDADFQDDEEFDAADFNETDPDTSGDNIAVDDSTLKPVKGGTP